MQTEDNGNAGVSPEAQTVNAGCESIAADIQALYDQFSAPQKTWFIEQLRRGARGEPTFLDDPDEHSYEAWIRQPNTAKAKPGPAVRVPNTLAVEDDLDEARKRLSAVEIAVAHSCTDREVGNGLAYIVGDVVDMLQDASNTLGDMRLERGEA